MNGMRLVATWFGSGLLPGAPGTWGSLAALPPAALFAWYGGSGALAAAGLAAFAIGVRAADRYAADSGEADPGAVVIDEVAALWLVLAALPFTLAGWLLGFVAFRAFDIAKPFPIRRIERRVRGGLGVMVDDVAAAAYAVATLHAIDGISGHGSVLG